MNRPPKNLLEFFRAAGKLKDVVRAGWKHRNVKDPESVADHSWLMTLMALILSRRLGLDENKAMKLALIHDLAEAVIGDYRPGEISSEDKHNKERVVMADLCRDLGKVGEELMALWEEHESQISPEAKLVKEIDRLEMALQAAEYEAGGRAGNLQEFIDSVEGFFKTDETKGLFEILKEGRKDVLKK